MLALGAATIVSIAKYELAIERVAHPMYGPDAAVNLDAARATFTTWRNRMYVTASAFVVSGMVTAFLWNRNQTSAEFSVQPTPRGATVSFGRAF
jgi:hypothetical protein